MSVASIASTGIALEAVKRDNYKYWSVQVKDYLSGQNLWHMIDTEGNQKKDEGQWQSDNARALRAIRIACGYDALDQIKRCETAKEAWDLLDSIYGSDVKFDIDSFEFKSDVDELHRALTHRQWDIASSMISQNRQIVHELSEFTGLTAIHVAIDAGQEDIIKKLVLEDKDLLFTKDKEGYTPLAFVSNFLCEEMKIAKWLVCEGGDTLLTTKTKLGDIPVILAAAKGHKKLTEYLFFRMKWEHLFENDGYYADKLLTLCIHAEIIDVAAALLQCNPSLHSESQKEMSLTREFDPCKKPILELACKPNLFRSGAQFNMFQLPIYEVLAVPTTRKKSGKTITIKSQDEKTYSNVVAGGICKLKSCVGNIFTKVLILLPGVKKVYEMKVNHHLAIGILKCLCERVKKIPSPIELHELSVQEAMLKASQKGIYEFVELMGKANSDLLWITDVNKRGVFAHAILNRQRHVFDLIYDIEGRKKLVTARDFHGNNLLHLAAELPHSSPKDPTLDSAIIKLQGDIQWYKEIETILPRMFKHAENASGVKPRELFYENRKELLKEGAEWSKKTASAFMVIVTLIMGNTFSTAFAMRNLPYSFFICAIGLAFISAAVAVLTFVDMITSGYNDEVFMDGAPKKLAYSQLYLFIAVVLLISAFGFDLVPQLKGHTAVIIIFSTMSAINAVVFMFMLRPFVRIRNLIPRWLWSWISWKKTRSIL